MDKKTREKYTLLAEFLHKTLGSEYEVVLHDFQGQEHSIAYIANGHISGRSMENPLTDTTLKLLSDKTISENEYIISNKGITDNNKVIRHSTLFIKDDDNKLTGMLCVNFNGSKYVNIAKKILQLTHMENASIESEYLHTFSFKSNIPESISQITEKILDNALEFSDVPLDRLTQEEKLEVVKELNDKGIFMLKGAVSEIAEKLDVSEATLYRYIRTVSKGE
ncbi:MAG: PAS domain-containing protein [Tissierellaceae bacterium]